MQANLAFVTILCLNLISVQLWHVKAKLNNDKKPFHVIGMIFWDETLL